MASIKAQLKSNGNNIFPNPNLAGIDTENILASYTTGTTFTSYTASQDCIVFFYGATVRETKIYIDNVELLRSYTVNDLSVSFNLKKGQTLTADKDVHYITIFGLKY